MNIAITGHASGIGSGLYDFYKNENCIGFDLTNGYDISADTDDILFKSRHCNIFINNAYSKHKQAELALAWHKLHSNDDFLLVNINSAFVMLSKDEQLKNILEVLSTKLALSPKTAVHDVDISQPAPTITLNQNGLLELKRYLKFIGIGNEERKIIRNRFAARYGSDTRIIQKEGIFYVDLSKYDYTDLL
jgi:hypothetical protein